MVCLDAFQDTFYGSITFSFSLWSIFFTLKLQCVILHQKVNKIIHLPLCMVCMQLSLRAMSVCENSMTCHCFIAYAAIQWSKGNLLWDVVVPQ